MQSAACAVLSANEYVNGGVGLVAPGLRDFFNDRINQSRRLIGCTSPDVEPPPPEFEGGQCPGVSYRLDVVHSATATLCNGTSPAPNGPFTENGVATLVGPVTSITTYTASTVCPNGRPSRYGVRYTDQGGARTRQTELNSTAARYFENISVSPSLVYLSGSPSGGDCGSLPPVYPPPIDIDIDIDIDYDDDDGNPISITIPFTFAPFIVNFDGSISAPFSFDFGGFTFDGSLELSPEIDVNINLPKLPRGTGQGTEGLPPGPPADEVEPLEAEEKIIGLVVSSTVVNQGALTQVDADIIPDLWIPRLGSVKFAYSFGGTTFWSSDIDVKSTRTFIPCPFSQGADFAAASPVPGVTMSTVQIRGFAIATQNDLAQLS